MRTVRNRPTQAYTSWKRVAVKRAEVACAETAGRMGLLCALQHGLMLERVSRGLVADVGPILEDCGAG